MDKQPIKLNKKESTAAEIDCRIHALILKFLGSGELNTKQTIGYLRSAYAQGYTDCLKEPEGQRGKWIVDLGYGVEGVDLDSV
jgi:hypothetical protein